MNREGRQKNVNGYLLRVLRTVPEEADHRIALQTVSLTHGKALLEIYRQEKSSGFAEKYPKFPPSASL